MFNKSTAICTVSLCVSTYRIKELSEEFEVKVGVHQGSALSPLLFAIVVTESVRSGSMSEMLYADDLILTSKTINQSINQ